MPTSCCAASWEQEFSLYLKYEDTVAFYSPDICFEDARKYIPDLATRRGVDPSAGLRALDQLAKVAEMVDQSLYEEHEEPARNRIVLRDPADWPIGATALLLDCPIWTEDRDFFGIGVATWTTQSVAGGQDSIS
jgi:predicted nucleic acid-binding protein